MTLGRCCVSLRRCFGVCTRCEYGVPHRKCVSIQMLRHTGRVFHRISPRSGSLRKCEANRTPWGLAGLIHIRRARGTWGDGARRVRGSVADKRRRAGQRRSNGKFPFVFLAPPSFRPRSNPVASPPKECRSYRGIWRPSVFIPLSAKKGCK